MFPKAAAMDIAPRARAGQSAASFQRARIRLLRTEGRPNQTQAQPMRRQIQIRPNNSAPQHVRPYSRPFTSSTACARSGTPQEAPRNFLGHKAPTIPNPRRCWSGTAGRSPARSQPRQSAHRVPATSTCHPIDDTGNAGQIRPKAARTFSTSAAPAPQFQSIPRFR